ncbi:glycine betaine ABC transporter substrate-binding protein [Rugamonas sp. CCM 8940]|uniref:glycine betaine ABC transporter substrate-binding protein n=1 Tax=Rugamonas sp. CCM 8940 TaxID=2765359 RepID=UPI0018F3EDA7|nr:glycine betaine ABC transporter substrate-binding protein [Rugamonas sp. CCM 8940]MBJ7308669.1 glycine betaine ABC transporter substrate-binding protein [Rugamonas sp. CCM 8940]
MTAPLRLGHIDLSFHAASAAVVQAVLLEHGVAVALSTAPHEAMFQALGRGAVDLMVSAWLPASHGGYIAPMREQVRELTVLYRPYCIWGVPDYVPEELVASVDDLLRPEVLARMERTIQGINPGAGISRFSAAMVDAYGLAEAGYRFRPGSEEDCFGTFEHAVAQRRWLVVPLWSPQFLHHRHRIRALREPRGMLGGTDAATLIVRRAAECRIGDAALRALAGLHLGNAVVTELDHQIRVEGRAPLAVAQAWLGRQRG